MGYIGYHHSPIILGPNTRDDIVPDGSSSTFTLSQEVPGGSEENVFVFRRKYLQEDLVVSNAIAFTGTTNKISTSNASIAAALSVLQKGITNVRPADGIKISGAANGSNNSGSNYFEILDVVYNGTTIEITVNASLVTESAGATVTLTRGIVGVWEILQPEVDYTIEGSGLNYNKQISFSEIPQESDIIYIIHKGESTYNLVPSQGSVGPDQLQQNLRNFVIDKFTGDGTDVDFTLTQEVVTGKSIIVSIDGVIKDPKNDDNPANTGDYYITGGTTLNFAVAPTNLSKIRVLHLGFSTVSRRAALSPSQVGAVANGSITETKLATSSVTETKIAANAVTSGKIAANAVTQTKILLDNNQYLNAKNTGGSSVGLIKIDGSNDAYINSANDVNLNNKIKVQSNKVIPVVTDTVDLGSSSNKIKDGYFSGNVVVDGNVDGVDVSALYTLVQSLQTQINTLISNNVGKIEAFVTDGTVPTFTDKVLCDGSVYSTASKAALYAKIGNAYNTGGEGAGNFRVPNLSARSLIGKSNTGPAAGWGASTGMFGSLDHTHTAPSHTHDLANHTHSISPHFHKQDTGIGSTLNITNSGTHTTSLEHDHPAVDTSTDGITITVASGGGHDHVVSTSTTSVTINSTNSDHQHSTTGKTSDSGTGTPNYIRCTGSGGTSQEIKFPRSGVDGGHTHTITDPGHSHTTSAHPGHVHTASNTPHKHTVNVANFTGNSASTGGHIHAASDITGNIGNVSSGNDGDAGFSSGTPNTNVTGSGGAGTTSTANHACLVCYFFINT